MKTYGYGLFVVMMVLFSCEPKMENANSIRRTRDTISPVIRLIGAEVDTTYLQVSSSTLIANGVSSYTWLPGSSDTEYDDPGVSILDERDGVLQCTDIRPEITGRVNTRSPGVYYLNYKASDEAGNTSATLTRTVHVFANSTASLSGIYTAACTCSTIIAGSLKPTVTTHTYLTAVSPGVFKNSFDAGILNIGPTDVIPSMFLSGNAISVSFYLSPADFDCNTTVIGTLSAAKNSFTIESTVRKWSPVITYHCVNVFERSKRSLNASGKTLATNFMER